MKLSTSILSTVLMAFILSGCVTTRSELNEQRAQGGNAASDSEENNSSSVKSENLEETSSEAPATAPTSKNEVVHASPVEPAPIASQYGMEEMRAELAKLSGRIEEMEQEKKNQQNAQSEDQKKLQAKIDELEKKLKEKEAEAAGPVIPEGKTPFQAGKDAYHANQYEAAIQFFDVFLKSAEHGKTVEEATYLRGESYLKLKQHKKAIIDYSKFPEKFPKSNYHPKALLRIAECFEALGMKEDAKAFYLDLQDKFPKTVEGKLAKKKLAGKSSKK